MESEGVYFFKGPDFDFDFAVNDAYIFNLYSYRILVFKVENCEGHNTTTRILKEGLQKLVERCPPLGGIVYDTENKSGEQHGWKRARPGPGIKLVVRDLRSSLNYEELEAKQFPPEAMKCEDVVPISPAPILAGDAPGSVFQYTWITGGALLTVGIDHPIADGNGMNTLMGILAEECKSAQLSPAGPQPTTSETRNVLGTDRTLVRALQGTIRNKPEDHPSYGFLPEPPSSEHEGEHGSGPDITMFMFQITPDKLKELKELANRLYPRVSTHDAISALTWRSIMLARYKAGTIEDLDVDVEYHCPTNCRRFVGLESDYIGNMVYYVTCRMPLRVLLGRDGIPEAAALIRKALEARNEELLSGFHSLCKSLPDLKQFTFDWIPRCVTTAFSIGTSWRADQMYGAEWGEAFGPVMRFRSPDVGFFGIFRGLVMICPRVQGSGPAEFQAWLEPEGWKALQEDELFTRFCGRICA